MNQWGLEQKNAGFGHPRVKEANKIYLGLSIQIRHNMGIITDS